MSEMVDVGGIRAKISADISDYRTAIDKAKAKTRELGDSADKATRSFGGMGEAIAALGAGTALGKMIGIMREVVSESNKMYNALTGLRELSKGLGQDVNAVTKAAQDLAAKGFMSMADAAEAYKTALATGYSLEEATKLINSMSDAAAFNRQSHYDMAGAVLASLQGIKNQNSELTDAVGITTNLSVMYERYAATLGKSAAKLTDAEKSQAALNGFLSEAALYAGNADTAMQGYTGASAEFTQSITNAKVALGDGLKPVFEEIMRSITPVIVSFAEWADDNKELVAGLATGTTTVLALVTALLTATSVVKALSIALKGMQASAGVFGVISLAIGVVVGGLSALIARNKEAAEAVKAHDDAQQSLNQTLREAPYGRSVDDVKALQKSLEELNPVLEERAKLQERLNEIEAFGERGEGTPALLSEALDISDALEKIDKQLYGMGYDTFDDAAAKAREMKDAINDSIPALAAMEREQLANVAAQVQHIDKVNMLKKEYEDLNAKEKLSAEQKQRLSEVVKALTQEYPSLVSNLDEENRWHIKNYDALGDLITAERNSVDASAQASKSRLENWRRETEAKLKLARSQLEALMGVESASVSNPKLPSALAAYVDNVTEGTEKALQTKANQYQLQINELDKDIQNITAGAFDKFVTSTSTTGAAADNKASGKAGSTKTAAEKAAEARRKAFETDLATIQYQTEMFDWSADRQIQAYEKLQKTHSKYLKESIDDRRTLNLQLKRLQEDSAQSQFDFSAEWIDREERRMEESGKTEQEIARMKFDAWTRVRDRYAKDTEMYKRADEELYRARKDLTAKTIELSNDLVKTEKTRIDDAKKRELDALKKSKQAALDKYNAEIDAIDELMAKQDQLNADIDYETELREKQARADLLASAVGPEGIQEREDLLKEIERMKLEHDRDLQKRSLEEQKSGLERERDAQEAAFDAEISRTEAQYDALLDAFSSYGGDIKTIEAAISEFRVSEAAKANATILADLDAFVAQYSAKMATVTAANQAADLAEYNANKDAYDAAAARGDRAEMERLRARNQAIRDQYGITQDTGRLQSFKVGGIVRGQNGEPVMVQAHAGEMVLNAQQQAVLFEALSGVSARPVTQPAGAVTQNTYNIDMGAEEIVIEDSATARQFFDERARVVQRLQTEGVKTR
ncbi:hypothetical protein [Paenibacillus macerans]|uniref:hypothetical protein n=1 Tax=Paenibacillus macerans TaxID=44252 RepID=UPI003D31F87C